MPIRNSRHATRFAGWIALALLAAPRLYGGTAPLDEATTPAGVSPHPLPHAAGTIVPPVPQTLGADAAANPDAPDAPATPDSAATPPVPATPVLLFAGYAGGRGDQMFDKLDIRGRQVNASGGGLRISVTLTPTHEFEIARMQGSVNRNAEIPQGADTPREARLPRSNVSYGFRQVDRILQQPFVHIGNIKLWDWTFEEAQDAKGRFAPYMADSRIRFVTHGPVIESKRTYLVVGWSDGGNSCFQGDARDRHQGSRMNSRLNTGGGGGTSSWVFLFNEDGEQVYPGFALRGNTDGAVFDAQGRLILWGRGINGSQGRSTFNISDDGGAVMILAPDWSQWEFRQAMGSMVTAVTFDERSGIFAACGYTANSDFSLERERRSPQRVRMRPFTQTNPVQEKPGERYDAFLVVWRMPVPSDP